MPRLPAFCSRCGAIYPSAMEAPGPGRDNAFDIPVKCPSCGGRGAVPPEILSRVAGAVDLVLAVAGDAEEREALVELAGELTGGLPGPEGPGSGGGGPEDGVADGAGDEGADRTAADGSSPEGRGETADPRRFRLELARTLARRAPASRGLMGHLPPGSPAQMKAFFAFVETALELAAEGPNASGDTADTEAPGGAAEEDRSDALANRVVTETLERRGLSPRPEPSSGPEAEARSRLRETGRNEPCPCGSGDKYKDCHWQQDLQTTRT